MTPSNTREQTLFGKRQYSRLPERAMKRGSRFCPRLLRKLIVRGRVHEHADATHAVGLLSSNPERAASSRSTKKCDEIPPPHSRLSSTMTRSDYQMISHMARWWNAE